MNGKHRQRYGTTLCLLTNPASACNLMMVGFEFGDIVIELRSELSDLSDDDNVASKAYESRILEGESSSDESDEETH
ncbi:hypothetical protein TNCV_1540501 [Trichonephila clavipes]|nr:hypothetical protein TNCV_1540501 [Trichonephila clavipes]